MSKNKNGQAGDLRVLVSGCVPPPMGGMATFYESLLASSLPERVDLSFVNTSSQKRTFEQGGRASLSNILQSFVDCGRFAQAMHSHRPAIAHIGTAYGLSFVKHSLCVLIAYLFGSQVLLHPHCSYMVLYEERSPLWKWYVRRVIRLVDGVVALSQEWLALNSIASNCKVYSLPNAVRLEPYKKIAQDRACSSARTDKVHILYLGHLGKDKGSFDLVEAARAVLAAGSWCEFHLIGGDLTPGESDLLGAKVKEAGLEKHIQVCPPVTGEAKLAAYRWADIFVYPSYAEGMPMAVIEAMACGLPIIASCVGGLPDLVTDGLNGLLVEPGQIKQLAAVISHLVNAPMLRESMGQRSYSRATNDYDFESRVTELVAIYAETVCSD